MIAYAFLAVFAFGNAALLAGAVIVSEPSTGRALAGLASLAGIIGGIYATHVTLTWNGAF